jgi:hypothetical protein
MTKAAETRYDAIINYFEDGKKHALELKMETLKHCTEYQMRSSDIDRLIESQGRYNVCWQLLGVMKSNDVDGVTDDEIIEVAIAFAGRYALNTHRINNTSNISVEMETLERLAWVEAYNYLTTGSVWGNF